MTEKDLDSMATVQIKPEYAASEVYSTTSEPPPAYKRQSTSVQIARIVAFTVIASSFIIGAFILASAYLQARASCDQMQALDSVLEKELMLETLQQVNKEIPRAEALIGRQGENDEADLQALEKDESKKEENTSKESEMSSSTNSESDGDSSFSDTDEVDDLKKPLTKVPLELDLSDLAAALLENNQKSRMNCVVERKHAEEFVDSPGRTMHLPFGFNVTTDPKKAKITGERISIFCESGNEDDKRNDDAEQIRPIIIPIQRFQPIPFGPQPHGIPLTHMPQSMPPRPQMNHQIPPPFQQLPPIPPQFMRAPPVEPQVRIHVQRIPVHEIHVPVQNQNEMPVQVQQVPLDIALQRSGITPDDFRNIQRLAIEKINALHRFAMDESSSSGESSSVSEEDESESQSNEPVTHAQQPPQPQQELHPPMPPTPILQLRSSYARSLPTPIHIPVNVVQSSESMHELPATERHFVQPRSIRSVGPDPFKSRLKRCACDCAC